MTHTPGPWYVEGESYNVGEAEVIVSGIPNGGGRIVAWTANSYEADSDNETTTAEDRANARLIAAAPDLLEACEVANRFFEQNDDFTDGEYPIPGFILDMRIAIKKARRTPLTKATGQEEED